jgi:hypothetical protein
MKRSKELREGAPGVEKLTALEAEVGFLRRAVEALRRLHHEDIVHGDLWPGSIIIEPTVADDLWFAHMQSDTAREANLPTEELARANPDAEVDPIVHRAAKVIGDREEAFRWMGTPVRALGYVTPISLLATDEGRSQVLTVLDRLEHGVL